MDDFELPPNVEDGLSLLVCKAIVATPFNTNLPQGKDFNVLLSQWVKALQNWEANL